MKTQQRFHQRYKSLRLCDISSMRYIATQCDMPSAYYRIYITPHTSKASIYRNCVMQLYRVCVSKHIALYIYNISHKTKTSTISHEMIEVFYFNYLKLATCTLATELTTDHYETALLTTASKS